MPRKIDFNKRLREMHAILDVEAVTCTNDYQFPVKPERYLVTEWDQGDIVWAQPVKSLAAAKRYLNASDTCRDSAWVYDLDQDQHWVAISEVTEFFLEED